MKEVKRLTRVWAKEKCIRDEKTLQSIEEELAPMSSSDHQGFETDESKVRIYLLEFEHTKNLKAREETWCLRSRAI